VRHRREAVVCPFNLPATDSESWPPTAHLTSLPYFPYAPRACTTALVALVCTPHHKPCSSGTSHRPPTLGIKSPLSTRQVTRNAPLPGWHIHPVEYCQITSPLPRQTWLEQSTRVALRYQYYTGPILSARSWNVRQSDRPSAEIAAAPRPVRLSYTSELCQQDAYH
jgi:hypothetical protein